MPTKISKNGATGKVNRSFTGEASRFRESCVNRMAGHMELFKGIDALLCCLYLCSGFKPNGICRRYSDQDSFSDPAAVIE
jgi:hypothetical protein